MLAGVVQPLSGEYAGRRSALETLPFVMGWGVEIGLLIDVCERFGFDAVAQVDLGVREHRNRPLAELGPQALAVLVTALGARGSSRSVPTSRSCSDSIPPMRPSGSRSRSASDRRS